MLNILRSNIKSRSWYNMYHGLRHIYVQQWNIMGRWERILNTERLLLFSNIYFSLVILSILATAILLKWSFWYMITLPILKHKLLLFFLIHSTKIEYNIIYNIRRKFTLIVQWSGFETATLQLHTIAIWERPMFNCGLLIKGLLRRKSHRVTANSTTVHFTNYLND